MNYINRIILTAVLSLIFSCNEADVRYSRIDFIIPAQINIRQDELLRVWADEDKRDLASSITIAVTIYSYSSGSETLSFSGNGDMHAVQAKGRVKCLVKVMNGKELIRAEFVEGTGNSREEIFFSLIKEIKRKLFKYGNG